jgi:hypothetical protein
MKNVLPAAAIIAIFMVVNPRITTRGVCRRETISDT